MYQVTIKPFGLIRYTFVKKKKRRSQVSKQTNLIICEYCFTEMGFSIDDDDDDDEMGT